MEVKALDAMPALSKAEGRPLRCACDALTNLAAAAERHWAGQPSARIMSARHLIPDAKRGRRTMAAGQSGMRKWLRGANGTDPRGKWERTAGEAGLSEQNSRAKWD